VSVGNAGDNVTIRFVTDNDGRELHTSSCTPWMILIEHRHFVAHSHIDWHLEACVFIHAFPPVRSY
jgi:hypothetical protein